MPRTLGCFASQAGTLARWSRKKYLLYDDGRWRHASILLGSFGLPHDAIKKGQAGDGCSQEREAGGVCFWFSMVDTSTCIKTKASTLIACLPLVVYYILCNYIPCNYILCNYILCSIQVSELSLTDCVRTRRGQPHPWAPHEVSQPSPVHLPPRRGAQLGIPVHGLPPLHGHTLIR